MIGSPANPYYKTSVIGNTYLRTENAIMAAEKEYRNEIESYISKLTGSTDSYNISRGRIAVERALALENKVLERRNSK